MEREIAYRPENQQNAVNFFPANPPAVNMAEMMNQTHFGYYQPNWEVYRDTVGHDGVRRLERYTPDRKIGAVEQVNGWSRFVERDYRGEDPRSGEGYLETDKRKNYYTKIDDLLVVWRDSYGNPIHTMGNSALMSEYSSRSDDLLKRHEAYLRQQEIIRQREARRQEFLRQQAIRAHQGAVRRNQEAIRQYQARLAYHQEWLRGQQIYPGPMPYESPYGQPARPIPPYAPAPRLNMAQAEQYRAPQPPVAPAAARVAYQENQRRQEPNTQRPPEIRYQQMPLQAHPEVRHQQPVQPIPPYMPNPRSAAAQAEQYRTPNPVAETQGSQIDQADQQEGRRSLGEMLDRGVQRVKLGVAAGVGFVGAKTSQGKGLLRRFADRLDRDFIEKDPVMARRIEKARIVGLNGEELDEFSWKDAQLAGVKKLGKRSKKAGEVTAEKSKSGAGKAGRGLKKAGEVTYNAVGAVVLGTAAAGALGIEGAKKLTASNEEAAKRMSVPVIDYLHEQDAKSSIKVDKQPYTQYKKQEFKYSEWDNTSWEGTDPEYAKKERQSISKNDNKYLINRTGAARVISGSADMGMKNELDSHWTDNNLAENVNTENTSFVTNFIRKITMRNRKGQYVSHEDGLTKKEREEIYKQFPQKHS